MVPGAPEQRWDRFGSGEAAPESNDNRQPLPVAARIAPSGSGWEVRVPLRAEQVAVQKQTMVAEQVTIRRNQIAEVVRVHDTIAREQLTVEVSDNLERVQEQDGDVIRARPRE